MPGDNRGFSSIVFDFDSTLTGIEGIDVLAGELFDEVAAMTERAMSGDVPLEEVYARRLELIRPDREAVEHLALRYVEALVPDAAETIGALRRLGKELRVVSGGLLQPVRAAAGAIGIHPDEVAAVPIEFTPDGRYAGFDQGSPLARSGGKEEAIRSWKLPRPVLLVGDGATDLEARPAVDAFAAFTGFERRPEVEAAADFVIPERSLAPVLKLAASPAELARLAGTRWAPLLERSAVPRAVTASE